jgi:pyruvate/2-oxoglutarate/acetoin dehydrogenase E1 component
MSRYSEELTKAMRYLGEHPKTVFLGQAVAVPGTIMSPTFADVPMEKRIELPVAEDLQMGMTLGWALNGFVPVSIFPRWNFMLLGTGQLLNHLDKIGQMSQGGYRPKMIIRTSIGATKPLSAGCQHSGDYTEAFKLMLANIEVVRLDKTEDIMLVYEKALNRTDGKSTIAVEYGDYFNGV